MYASVVRKQSIYLHEQEITQVSMGTEVHAGLSADQKHLPAKFFYDKQGSELFDAITELPEYYQTRTELALLERHVDEIYAATGIERARIRLVDGEYLSWHGSRTPDGIDYARGIIDAARERIIARVR